MSLAADLTADRDWADAAAHCDFVLHVASPFPAKQPEDANELIAPARDGALRVLRAARDANVRRVIMTSSFAAVGYGREHPGRVYTEDDWTEEDAPNEPMSASTAGSPERQTLSTVLRAMTQKSPLRVSSTS
jgi:dihydroflavonol-4-reductase